MRGKSNKAKLVAPVFQSAAVFTHWDVAEMSKSKEHPQCFTSAGEATPGLPTTLEDQCSSLTICPHRKHRILLSPYPAEGSAR